MRSLCLLALLGAALSPAASASAMPTLTAQAAASGATMPDGSPLPTALPTTGRNVSVSSVAVPSLQAGESLDVSVEAEVTDDVIVGSPSGSHRWIDVPVSSELILTSNAEATTGTVLAPAAGGVVGWREHHGAISRDGTFVVPQALQGQSLYVNLVLASAPSPAPSGCLDYLRSTGSFVRAAAGCSVHVENDEHLVDLSVRRTPPAGSAGFAAALSGGAASDAWLPVPSSSASPGYGQWHVVWASTPVTAIRAGDVLDASVQLQASIEKLVSSIRAPGTATTGCNVMLAGRLFLSPYPDRLPAPGDPLGNAVPVLSDGYAFNLTQSAPRALTSWHGEWTADGNYPASRYVVLGVWASGGDACQSAIAAGALGLHVEASGSGGSALHLSAAAANSWQEGQSSAGANGATQLAGVPSVVSVVPVRLRAGDIVSVSAQAALANAASAYTGVQLVLGSTYSGPQDVSGAALTPGAQAMTDAGSDRSLITLRGALSANASTAIEYVKLVAWSKAGVRISPQATRVLVDLLRAGSQPTAGDLPTPLAAASTPTAPPASTATAPTSSTAPPPPPAARASAAKRGHIARVASAAHPTRGRHARRHPHRRRHPRHPRRRGRRHGRRHVRARG